MEEYTSCSPQLGLLESLALATLIISPHHLEAIRTHAERTYPEECCGIMLGKLGEDGKTVVEVWETENVWSAETAEEFLEGEGEASKKRRYAIAPKDMLKAQREARDRSLDIVGIYHSHPDHPAIPSEMDRAIAWSVYSYIIVSVAEGKAVDLKSWCLDEAHQFQPEEITEIKNLFENRTDAKVNQQ